MAELRNESQRKMIMILYAGGFAVLCGSLALAWFIIQIIGSSFWQGTILSTSRNLLLVFYATISPPLAIFCEYWLSRWKMRKFLWKGVFLILGTLGILFVTSASLSTIFIALFPGVDLTLQMPLAAVSNSTALIIMAIVIRNGRSRKLFKDLGW